MVRITIIEILSFLLPFGLFFLWRMVSTSAAAAKPAPVLKLAAAGAATAVVVMIGLVLLDSSRGGHEGDQYVPPRMVDGEIQPGYFIRSGEAEEDADEDTGEDAEDPPGDDPQ